VWGEGRELGDMVGGGGGWWAEGGRWVGCRQRRVGWEEVKEDEGVRDVRVGGVGVVLSRYPNPTHTNTNNHTATKKIEMKVVGFVGE